LLFLTDRLCFLLVSCREDQDEPIALFNKTKLGNDFGFQRPSYYHITSKQPTPFDAMALHATLYHGPSQTEKVTTVRDSNSPEYLSATGDQHPFEAELIYASDQCNRVRDTRERKLRSRTSVKHRSISPCRGGRGLIGRSGPTASSFGMIVPVAEAYVF
jgi:hypothetical protein